jgi:hypothetical protein
MKEFGMTGNTFTLDVQHDDAGEAYIEFPQETMAGLGWKEGDTVVWADNNDGSFTLTKKNTEWVLVETVQTFRHRYMVEVPRGKSEWALDTVTMEEAQEFSQKHLGETIVSHRVVSYDEAMRMCDEDNGYVKNTWTNLKKREVFFTPIKEDEE